MSIPLPLKDESKKNLKSILQTDNPRPEVIHRVPKMVARAVHKHERARYLESVCQCRNIRWNKRALDKDLRNGCQQDKLQSSHEEYERGQS